MPPDRRSTPRLAGFALAAAAALAACPLAAHAQALPPLPADPGRDAARFHATLEAARLHMLLDADWQFQLDESPERASALGEHRGDDRLDDHSPEAFARRDAHARELLKALRRIDRDALAGEDRISFDCALRAARLAVHLQHYPALRTQVLSAVEGPQIELPALMADTPVRTAEDARHALARLRAMPARIAQDIALLREGRRLGWIDSRPSLSGVPAQIDALVDGPQPDNPLVAPFRRLPASMPPDARGALQDDALAVLHDQVLPAFAELRQVVADELLPDAPDEGALSARPDGEAIYRLLIRAQGAPDTDPQAIHQRGLDEVARLHARIAALMRGLGFGGSYADFVAATTHDPKFLYADADALLAGYRDLAKRVDPLLTSLFLVLPRAPYGIRAIPAYEGAAAPDAYTEGAADGSTPGWFDVDVAAPSARPKWSMPARLLREAVPGRHLQASRAHELLQLPAFRRHLAPGAYVEGWALHAESLGDELGLYADPYARYGWLQDELASAAGLVVDTGLHALGWHREQAIAYLVDEAGASPDEAAREVDRACMQPARALGAGLGWMTMRALRGRAESALGQRFDLRAFDQELVDHGALPLPELEAVVGRWIAREQAGLPAPPPLAP